MRQAAEPLGGNESTMSQYNTSQTPLPEPLPAADELSSPLAHGGQRVGPYVLRAPMGEGPTGTLFHADHDDGTTAMVRLIPRSLSSRLAVEQFTLQQQALAALGSAHFVRRLFAGEEASFFYVGCELLNGCDLHTALSLSGGIHRRKALEIARQICVGLELAHQAGIVHGALHPLNVYLATGKELTVKLLDFGAHALGARPGSLVILGDPAYLAPEQFGGTTARTSDVYTLAQLTFELLSGRRLVEATGASATAGKLGGRDPTAPQLFDPTLSALLQRSLSRDPAQRPPSVEAFRRALLAWADRSAAVLDGTGALDLPNLQKATAIPQQASVQTVRSQTGVQVNFSSQPMGNNMQSNGKAKDGAPPVAAASAGGSKPSSENESVEASLEEFINQANASFPTSDGWDLHTGDVELVDPEPNVEDDEELLAESDQTSVTSATELERKKAPRAADDLDLDAPRRPSTTQSFGSGVTSAIAAKQAEAAAKAKTTSKSMPAVAAPTEPAPQPGQPKKTTSKAMPVAAPAAEDELPPVPRKTTSKAMPAAQDDESTPAPKRPSRQMPTERTEVVAQPLPLPYQPPPPSWTTNPLVLIASMLVAFLVGAGGLFLMTRSNQQPIVVSAPIAAPAPAPTPAAAAAPVVTPLPTTTPAPTAAAPAATAPVVTPLPTEAKPEQPAAAAPAEPDDKAAKMAAIRSKLAKSGSGKASKSEAKEAKSEKKAEAKASEPKAAKATKPAKEEKPAPAKKEAAPKKGGDWVDPF